MKQLTVFMRIALHALAICTFVWSAFVHADLIYVSNEKDNSVSVIDTNTQKVVQTIAVGQRPRGITFSKDFKHLYICASDDDTIQVLDIATNKVLHNLPSGEDPEQFTLHPGGNLLYVANEDDAIVSVVDIKNAALLRKLTLALSQKEWAQVQTENLSLQHQKPQTWRIGLTPKPIQLCTIALLINALVMLSLIKKVIRYGFLLK